MFKVITFLIAFVPAVGFAGNVLDSEATDFESEYEGHESEFESETSYVNSQSDVTYSFQPFIVHKFDGEQVPGFWWTHQNFGLSNGAGWGFNFPRIR